jgi:hypothetical protein
MRSGKQPSEGRPAASNILNKFVSAAAQYNLVRKRTDEQYQSEELLPWGEEEKKKEREKKKK